MRAILILAVILSAPAARAQVFFDPADEIQRERVKASKWKRVLQEHHTVMAFPNEFDSEHTSSTRSWRLMEYDSTGRVTAMTSWPEKGPREISLYSDTERTTIHYSSTLRSQRVKYYTMDSLRTSSEVFFDDRGRPAQQIFSANPWTWISYADFHYGAIGEFVIEQYSIGKEEDPKEITRTTGRLNDSLMPLILITIGPQGDTTSVRRYTYHEGTKQVAEANEYLAPRPPRQLLPIEQIRKYDAQGKLTYEFVGKEHRYYSRRDTMIDGKSWERVTIVNGDDTTSVSHYLYNDAGLQLESRTELRTRVAPEREMKPEPWPKRHRGTAIGNRTYTSQVHVLEKY